MRRKVSGIRAALSAVCRLLSVCGCHFHPETFRRAKYNRPEAAPEFWKLLYCLLKQIYPRNEKQIEGNEIGYVKRMLQFQGYGRRAFYDVPDDDGGSEGSREALLAFSWLLYTGRILGVILQKRRLTFGDHIAFCTCSQNTDFSEVKEFMKSTKQDVDVRYLQWLNGRLRLRWRNLHTAHLEKCSILYKIHFYTQGCQLDQRADHLSAMEVELVRHPEVCNLFLQHLETENSCLEAYLEWKHLESVYWQWMETVVQSASEDEHTSVQNEINLSTSFSSEFKPRSNLTQITALQKSLSDVHDQFHELVKQERLLWNKQIKELEKNVKEKETSLSIKQIKEEVRKKTAHLSHQHEEVGTAHGVLRVVLKQSTIKAAIHKDFNLKHINAADLTTILQTAATKLEIEFQNLQDKSRKKLDVMTENLEGIVCIPPAKR